MMSESLVSKNLVFLEIPLRLTNDGGENMWCVLGRSFPNRMFYFLCLVFIHSNNYNECIKNKACRPCDLSCNQHKLVLGQENPAAY